MKKSIILLKILLILFILVFMFASKAYAGIFDEGFGYFLHDNTKIDIDIKLGTSGAESSSKEMTERILGWLQLIGSIISVIALAIIGFRYMFSSLEEKAQMKGILIYYVIGAVLVFATSNILSIVYHVINSIDI